MSEKRDPAEGGWVWRQLYKVFGPATVTNADALQGCTQEARDQWKRHLEARRRATP